MSRWTVKCLALWLYNRSIQAKPPSTIASYPVLSTCWSLAFDDYDFEITSAIPRSAAIPMDKVNGETRSKRAKWRSESAVIPAIRFFWCAPKKPNCRNDSRLRPPFGSFWTRFPVDLVHGDRSWPWYCAGDLKVIIVKGQRSASRKHGIWGNCGRRFCLNWSIV